MRCPVHFCTGEEAVPASLYKILNKEDYLFSHHRSHGYYLAKKSPMKNYLLNFMEKKLEPIQVSRDHKTYLIPKIIFIVAQYYLVLLQ